MNPSDYIESVSASAAQYPLVALFVASVGGPFRRRTKPQPTDFDKRPSPSIESHSVMAKWLTSLFLIAALGGSAVAGMPLHSGEQECDMPGMKDGADCCAKARAQESTPEATAARLCCALDCPSSGTTTPAGSTLRVSPPAAVAEHPAAVQTPFVIPGPPLRFDSAREHPQHSPPAYIRHLALLI